MVRELVQHHVAVVVGFRYGPTLPQIVAGPDRLAALVGELKLVLPIQVQRVSEEKLTRVSQLARASGCFVPANSCQSMSMKGRYRQFARQGSSRRSSETA